MKIGCIGLGKLGSVLAEVLAEHNEVVGVDLEYKFLENVTMSKGYGILKDCEVVFNVVNTPSLPNGDFSNEILFKSIESAKPYLKNCKVFIVVSTVMPGTCRKISKMLDCKVCYNPEFIRLNSIYDDMKNPDFVLIGTDDKGYRDNGGFLIKGIYEKIIDDAPIKLMGWESAELAKISLNAYITVKITFANIVGQIAKKIGADAETILDAIGNDHRIGTAYFKHGGAYGGPCFPRDTVAFGNVAGDIKNYADLTDEINKIVAAEGYFSDEERYQNIL